MKVEIIRTYGAFFATDETPSPSLTENLAEKLLIQSVNFSKHLSTIKQVERYGYYFDVYLFRNVFFHLDLATDAFSRHTVAKRMYFSAFSVKPRKVSEKNFASANVLLKAC